MPTITEFIALFAIIGGGWYWFDAMRARERTRQAGLSRCIEAGVIFLDDTVVLTRLRLRRDEQGHVRIHREYRFEFASDGGTRYGGEISLLGRRITRTVMEPFREAGPGRQGIAGTADRGANRWIH